MGRDNIKTVSNETSALTKHNSFFEAKHNILIQNMSKPVSQSVPPLAGHLQPCTLKQDTVPCAQTTLHLILALITCRGAMHQAVQCKSQWYKQLT
jgi:hypothetical protein